MKKTLSVLLILCILMTAVFTLPVSAFAKESTPDAPSAEGGQPSLAESGSAPDSYRDITLGDSVTVDIEASYDCAYFRFIPEEDMRIEFYSVSDSDTYATLYDADMNEITSNDDGGSGSGLNFRIRFDVEASKTYFFEAKFLGDGTGSFDVKLDKLKTWSYSQREDNTAEITAYNGPEAEKIVIPSELDGYPVTNIGSYILGSIAESVKEVVIPDSVTEIGYNAFYNCTALERVTFSKNLEEIEDSAFSYCISLKSLELPASLTYVSSGAFNQCEALASITVEDGNPVYDSRNNCNALIETIERYDGEVEATLVLGCQNSIIPDGVTRIGWRAFNSCKGLKKIHIPASVASIYGDSFRSCQELEEITVDAKNPVYDSRNNCNAVIETETNTLILGCKKTVIPNTTAAIGEYGFYNCKDLKSITLPDSVTEIGEYAFYNCDSLSNVTFGKSVRHIGNYAFAYTVLSADTVFPDSVSSVGEDAFSDTPWYESLPEGVIYIGKTAVMIKGEKEDFSEEIVIRPSTVSLSDRLFQECPNLKKVTLPDSLKYIGHSAFADCSSLEEVHFGNGLLSISGSAFGVCSSLSGIELPASLKHIGDSAFYNCMKLTSVTVPEEATVGYRAFGFGSSMEDWEDVSVEGFTVRGFEGSDAHRYATQNDFRFESTGKNVILSGQEKTITATPANGSKGFCFTPDKDMSIRAYSTGLKGGECTIYDDQFEWVGNSYSETGDVSVRATLKKGATYYIIVQNHEDMNRADNYDYTFKITQSEVAYLDYYQTGENTISVRKNSLTSTLKELNIPQTIDGFTVTDVAYSGFAGCANLEKITLPSTLKHIAVNGFNGCGMETVDIPSSVETVSPLAFSGCQNLKSVNVSQDNKNYVDIDGVLYNKDVTTLMCYPNAKEYAGVPASVTRFESGVFFRNNLIKTITIPDTVKEIGSQTFFRCENLTEVDLGNGLETIGMHSFMNDPKLEKVKIGDSLKSLKAGMPPFYGCDNIKEYTVSPKNPYFTSVDGVVYSKDMTSLERFPTGKTSFVLPETVTVFANMSFINTARKLENISVEKGNTAYDSRDNCNALIDSAKDSLIIGTPTTLIPESVKAIGSGAFCDRTELTQIYIPKSVTSVWMNAFDGCENLKDVYYGGSEEQWNQLAVDYGNDPLINATIHYNSQRPSSPETPTEPVSPTQPDTNIGDVDGDGVISVLDATRVQKFKARLCNIDGSKYDGTQPTEAQQAAADVDKDGVISVLDATRIQKFKAKLCNLDGTVPYKG